MCMKAKNSVAAALFILISLGSAGAMGLQIYWYVAPGYDNPASGAAI